MIVARDVSTSLLNRVLVIKEAWYASSSDLYDKFYLSYYNKLKAIEAEMKIRESEIEKIDKLNDSVESERKKVHDALDFEKYLGEKLWKIFLQLPP